MGNLTQSTGLSGESEPEHAAGRRSHATLTSTATLQPKVMPHTPQMPDVIRTRAKFVIAAITFTVLGCSGDQSALGAFSRLIESATTATERHDRPYFNQSHAKWSKRRFEIKDVKYDVRKTDSLVTSIVGSVSFELTTTQTPLFQTREEAQQSSAFDPNSQNSFRVNLNFAHRTGIWSFVNGRYTTPALPETALEVTPEKIAAEPDAIPFAALSHWQGNR